MQLCIPERPPPPICIPDRPPIGPLNAYRIISGYRWSVGFTELHGILQIMMKKNSLRDLKPLYTCSACV